VDVLWCRVVRDDWPMLAVGIAVTIATLAVIVLTDFYPLLVSVVGVVVLFVAQSWWRRRGAREFEQRD
jgi:hypothetical protein